MSNKFAPVPGNLTFVTGEATNKGLFIPLDSILKASEDEDAPARDYVIPTVNIHYVDSDHPRVGMMSVDYDANVVEAHFPTYYTDIVFQEHYYAQNVWMNMISDCVVENAFSFDVDSSKVATCQFFSPSLTSIAEEGAVEHPDYPYFNSLEEHVCLCPARAQQKSWQGVLYSLCQYPIQFSCRQDYKPSEWSTVATCSANGTVHSLQHGYVHNRVDAWRISASTEVDSTIIDQKTGLDADAARNQFFKEYIDGIDGAKFSSVVDIESVVEPTAVPVSFVSAVIGA